jgi:transcriptional regulator with XRE-family HTH domain
MGGPVPAQPAGHTQPGEARRRLGLELRRVRTAAGKTQRDIHGPTGSGHASNVENGRTQPSWDFIEKYLPYGGDANHLRSLYELARAESANHKTEQRRGSMPGSFQPPPAPQQIAGHGLADIRRHYIVQEREERYGFGADGVVSSLWCKSRLRATSPAVTLFCSVHAYDADQRPDLLTVEARTGCVVEYVDRHPTGSILAYFRLDRRLDPADPEPHECSFVVTINSSNRTRPILLAHPGPGTKSYTLQAQFTEPATPERIWWFAAENELSAVMPGDDYELVCSAKNCYRKTFDAIVPGWCYGFAWRW